jgi:hypothetical protein
LWWTVDITPNSYNQAHLAKLLAAPTASKTRQTPATRARKLRYASGTNARSIPSMPSMDRPVMPAIVAAGMRGGINVRESMSQKEGRPARFYFGDRSPGGRQLRRPCRLALGRSRKRRLRCSIYFACRSRRLPSRRLARVVSCPSRSKLATRRSWSATWRSPCKTCRSASLRFFAGSNARERMRLQRGRLLFRLKSGDPDRRIP